MHDTAKAPAITRTWTTVTEHRPYGEYWGDTTATVTVTRLGNQPIVLIDGQQSDVYTAARILGGATVKTVTHEVLEDALPFYVRRAQRHALFDYLVAGGMAHWDALLEAARRIEAQEVAA
ncbi:hypothetical protein SAMN04488058_101262 [Deinococcus reticulitermitis]|uniref:Uncharacterized protein n=1 Tax=Deinococcus reticulitermitis TaxID=856736 RepID=A0A1H6SG56_9DEIO|nr:hypothetical protein [Deinococcus reticulitermitis]SEI65856.1 hypothetical protein SAMN04488058_101262 [Deinococcus reticulitermitis]